MHASNSSVIAKWSDAKDTMFIYVCTYIRKLCHTITVQSVIYKCAVHHIIFNTMYALCAMYTLCTMYAL